MSVRGRLLRTSLRTTAGQGDVKGVARAAAAFVAPARWPPTVKQRLAALESAVAHHDAKDARALERSLAREPGGRVPGTPLALARASALVLVAGTLPPVEARAEATVAAFLRGDLASPAAIASDAGRAPERAARGADALRAAGHAAPIVVAAFPGFHANPYSQLMERAYERTGLTPVNVDVAEDVDAVVAGAGVGDYRTIVHLNAPDRFVPVARTADEAVSNADGALARIDGWVATGATLVTTVHNGPRLDGHRGAAERLVAQGILDRAAVIHVLARSTPRILEGWVTLDPGRIVHVPHPNFDGAYGPLPPRDAARGLIGLPPGRDPLVVGLIGTLADRKGGQLLLDALALVPAVLPDQRELRLVIAGMASGRGSEDLIRRAMLDPRVIARFGFVPDEELPALLAAIDVAVVPYVQYLNSGWLHLALSTGCPVIVPAGGTAEEVARPDALLTFTPNDARALATALSRAGELATPAARAAARASVADLDPDRLSEQLATAFVRAAGQTPASASAATP